MARTGHHAVRQQATGTTWTSPSLAGIALAVLGAVGIIGSIFMSWRAGGVHPVDIPAAFLWDRNATGDPSFLIWLIPIAAVMVIGMVVPGAGGLRGVAGLAMLVVCGLFAYQLDQSTSQSLGDALDTGFYFAAVGGLLSLLSAAFPSGWFGLHRERTDYDVDDRV